jgi:uncharacterized protein (TIGR03086 family)
MQTGQEVAGFGAQDPGMETNTLTPFETLAADDPRAIFASAMETARRVVAGVRPDQFDDPTPCDDFDVRLLLGHLVAVLQRVVLLGRGDDPFLVNEEITGVADDGWEQLWRENIRQVERAWADDEVLTRPMVLPWAQLPGGGMLLSYASELTSHTWDLAVATGQDVAWDGRVLGAAWEAIRWMGHDRQAMFEQVSATMPVEVRRAGPPFRNPVPVPDDAPFIDRLVAWVGRDPRWSPVT